MSALQPILPEGWPRPSGYSDGVAVTGASKLVFVAGQVAWNEKHELVGAGDLGAQFRQALANVVAVVAAAGGEAKHIASMTVFVTDLAAYMAARAELGPVWSSVMGKHYPAIALVQVAGLLEPRARVEIQATAAIPSAGKKIVTAALKASLQAGQPS